MSSWQIPKLQGVLNWLEKFKSRFNTDLHKKTVQFPSKSDKTDLKSLRLHFPRQSFAMNSTSSGSRKFLKEAAIEHRWKHKSEFFSHSPDAENFRKNGIQNKLSLSFAHFKSKYTCWPDQVFAMVMLMGNAVFILGSTTAFVHRGSDQHKIEVLCRCFN